MSCLPRQLLVYLNEQKINVLSKVAILADEFVLTYKTVFSVASSRKDVPLCPLKSSNKPPQTHMFTGYPSEICKCF